MHSERTRGVLGPTLCEARPQHLPRPETAGPFYTRKADHDIEAGPAAQDTAHDPAQLPRGKQQVALLEGPVRDLDHVAWRDVA